MSVWPLSVRAQSAGPGGDVTVQRGSLGQEDPHHGEDDQCLWRDRVCRIWWKYWKSKFLLLQLKDSLINSWMHCTVKMFA